MALSCDLVTDCVSIVWILLLFLSKSGSHKTQQFYMEGEDCNDGKLLGGATVYSHNINRASLFSDKIECRITFKAEHIGSRLMMRVVEMDIPDKSPTDLCNDALYIFDASTIMEKPVKQAGGIRGICGNQIPPIIYSTGPYLTVYFRTDPSGPKGRGFKLIVTAFSDDYSRFESCGSQFQCGNNLCIDEDLVCDQVDHCGDFTDESAFSNAQCGKDDSFLSKFLSLGITAAISITVGSVVVFIVCIVCVICCCCRCMRKRNQDPGGGTPPPTTTATSVTINNGGPHMPMPGDSLLVMGRDLASPAPSYSTMLCHEHIPYHKTYSDHASSYHQAFSEASYHQHAYSAHVPYHQAYSHQGYYPLQQVPQVPHQTAPPPSHMYSPFPAQRESYSQASMYSSQPPPSYHRSYTPTSSRSGRSMRSNDSSSVKYHSDKDKVALPINL